MRSIAGVVAVLVAGSMLFYACGGGDKPDETAPVNAPVTALPGGEQVMIPGQAPVETSESVEQMVERWKTLAKSATRENAPVTEATTLAQDIAVRDPRALLSLLDLVDDEASSPFVKVLATISLTPVVGPHVAGRLIEMTKSEKEATTRACATNMLRLIPSEEVTAVLRQLKTDAEPRVKLYAQAGLATRSAEDRQQAYALWHQPDLGPQEKGTIIDALAASPVEEDIPLMQEVLADANSDEGVRMLAAGAIGLVGGDAQIELLNNLSLNDPSEKVREIAKTALDDLKSRTSGQNKVTLPMQ